MGVFRFIKEIPFLYRLSLSLFLKELVLVLAVLTAVSSALTAVGFLNFAKVISLGNLFLYILSSVAFFLPLFFPLFVFAAAALVARQLLKKRLNLTIFTVGISPSVFLLPFTLTGAALSLLLIVYFQTLYPIAGYYQHIAYLKSKNKPLHTGIVQNFWYRVGENSFLTFKLINLKEGKAYGGEFFKVSPSFRLEKIASLPQADFRVKGNLIEVFAKELLFYTARGKVEKEKALKLSLPYDEKLLVVKKPEYFTLTELIKLTFTARFYGINFYPYLWELEKRLLVAIFTTITAALAFSVLLRAVRLRDFNFLLFKLSLLFFLFYLFIGFYQNLVYKISLNPLYGWFVIVPYLIWLLKEWKGN